LVGNSGNFVETTPLIWNKTPALVGRDSVEPKSVHAGKVRARETLAPPSAFAGFLRLSDWLHARTGRTDSIALMRLMELLFEFLTVELKLGAKPVAETLWRDYQRGGRHDKPGFLKDFLPAEEKAVPLRKPKTTLPKRQSRYLV
jgi:hypothetical protein